MENLKVEIFGDVREYDVNGVDPNVIVGFMDSDAGAATEWYDDKMITKIESHGKDTVAVWLLAYSVHMAVTEWSFMSQTHVVAGDNRWYLPSCSAIYDLDRPQPGEEREHSLLGRTLPHIVVEVERADLVDQQGKGFDKMRSHLFQLDGPNNTHIEEGWVVCIPRPLDTSVPIHAVAPEAFTPAPAEAQRPPSDVLFLAVMRRADPMISYFRLEANRTFRVPPYSLLSAAGPAGPPGALDLPINHLLRKLGYRFV